MTTTEPKTTTEPETIKPSVTTTEPCINEWTEWTEFDSCADRGAGPYEKQMRRQKPQNHNSGSCIQNNIPFEYEYENRDCDTEQVDFTIHLGGRQYDWQGTNANWGTG